MHKLAFTEIEKLFKQLIVPFYQIERIIPLPFKVRRNENDAEHSWSLAILACSLAPKIDKSLDVGRICQFANVHDLTELYAGDTSVWASQKDLDSKVSREDAALQKIQTEFKQFSWLTETLTEYYSQTTTEARFVRAVDKYITLLFDYVDEGQYYKEHKITKLDFENNMKSHRQKAQAHPEVAIYYEEIRTILLDHPEYFHQN